MPNKVLNRVTIEGYNAEKIIMSMLTFDEDGDEAEFDFNKVLPMPESLKIERSTRSADGLRLFIASLNPYIIGFGDTAKKMSNDSFGEVLALMFGETILNENLHCLLTAKEVMKLKKKYGKDLDEVLALGRQAFENQMRYNTTDWYQWALNNWGTKWNAYNTNLEEGGKSVTFETPWTPCIPVIRKLSEEFKGRRITLEFAEEQTGYMTGEYVFVDGEAVYQNDFDSFSKDAYEKWFDLWGYDDMFIYDEAKGNYVIKDKN